MDTRLFGFLAAALFSLTCFQQPAMAETQAGTRPDTMGQSFNGESRGVDITVLGAADVNVSAMTLDGFNIRNPSDVPIEARIYKDNGEVAASAIAWVHGGEGQSITVPLATTLTAGKNYRLALFIPESKEGNTMDGFLPEFPYTESSGLFRINQAYSGGANALPADVNMLLPMIKIEVQDASGKSSMIPLGSGRTVKPE